MNEEPFVDEDDEPDQELNVVTNLIIATCIEVHRHLGPGYMEACYEEALAQEFALRGISVERQKPFEVTYKGNVVGIGRYDFLVEGKMLVEIKAVESLAPVHTAQVISYLKSSGLRIGLLINFNVRLLKEGIKRIAR